jgi:hypothetical protein
MNLLSSDAPQNARDYRTVEIESEETTSRLFTQPASRERISSGTHAGNP